MDEKRLDELERIAKIASPGPWSEYHPGQVRTEGDSSDFNVYKIGGPDTQHIAAFDPPTVLDLIRLARLGLWSEKHGVTALKEAHALNANVFSDAEPETLSYYSEYKTVIKQGKVAIESIPKTNLLEQTDGT
ncbi:MAG: hypothetical protein IPO08_20800 [Xanthomonadales bacterium]|nr:hypothetical protein [Xanthomonadales bacterium]